MPPIIRRGLNLGPKWVHLAFWPDNMDQLDVFHRRTVEQCFEKVYCSGPQPYGLTVLPPKPGR